MAAPAIELLVVGVSHKTAPVGVRERLAVEPEAIRSTLVELNGLPGVRETAVLATCNRVELYVAVDDAERAAREIAEALARRAEVAAGELGQHLYEHRDAAAVRHLFRVASSLDSLVVGEPQILGQTKQAHEAAIEHGTAGSVLNTCFQGAFKVARRVRRETEIAKNPVSVSSVAVEFARQIVGDFAGRRVLVVSAGEMAELAVRALRAQGATVTITNRTRARAEALAAEQGAAVVDWGDLAGALTAADVVIASTGAQRPVLTLELMTRVQRARRGRPLALIDIAAPRDVEPAVGDLDGVYVADIDNLQKVAGQHLEEREVEAAAAETIVDEELERFVKAWRGRQRAPTVVALRAHVMGILQAEANRLLAGLAHLGEREKKAIADTLEGAGNKILHQPQMALRHDDDDGVPLVLAVQRLFALEVVAAAPPPEAEAAPDGADTVKASDGEGASEGEGKKATGR
jgi:glutamyl-tRNA reductase